MSEWNIQLPSFLSGIANLPQGPRKGRDINGGYIRGCGLQFGNLQALCQADPIFAHAYQLATAPASSGKPRTVVGALSLMNIFAILKLNLSHGTIPGHIVEFGSLRGGCAIFMAYAAQHLMPGTRVIGFDTFEGLPDVNTGIDIFRKGDFEHPDVEELRTHVASLGLDNLTFVKGPFEETLPAALREIGHVSLAHIDCDIHDAVVYSYDAVKPYLTPGAYIVLDDPLVPNCIGAFEAMEETLIRRDGLHAEQAFPHIVFRAPLGQAQD